MGPPPADIHALSDQGCTEQLPKILKSAQYHGGQEGHSPPRPVPPLSSCGALGESPDLSGPISTPVKQEGQGAGRSGRCLVHTGGRPLGSRTPSLSPLSLKVFKEGAPAGTWKIPTERGKEIEGQEGHPPPASLFPSYLSSGTTPPDSSSNRN